MFEHCNNSQETQEELIKIVGNTKLKDIQEEIAKSFYNVDDIVEFLYIAIITKNNGILHGPGGFGKSQITKAFFNYFGIKPLVIVGHSGVDVEALLGIPNIKKLTEESTYEVAFEKSVFTKPGILILEEFLDVKPTVAAALKDIITEGGYRRGDAFIPSKIGSIFICSNKAPDDVVIDLSTAAFYKERFPLSKYIIWNDYSSNAYMNLFNVALKDRTNEEDNYALKLIAEICSISCTADTLISPRIAIHSVNLFLSTKDIKSLSMITTLNLNKIDEIEAVLKIERQYKYLDEKFKNLIDLIKDLEILNLEDVSAYLEFHNNFKTILNYNLSGDQLLETISYFIKILDEKEGEVQKLLRQYGEKNKPAFKEINTIYEDIQEYLSS